MASGSLPYRRYIKIPGRLNYVPVNVVDRDEYHHGLFILVEATLGPAAGPLLGDKVMFYVIGHGHYVGAWIPDGYKSTWKLTAETVPGGVGRILEASRPPLTADDLLSDLVIPPLEGVLEMPASTVLMNTRDSSIQATDNESEEGTNTRGLNAQVMDDEGNKAIGPTGGVQPQLLTPSFGGLASFSGAATPQGDARSSSTAVEAETLTRMDTHGQQAALRDPTGLSLVRNDGLQSLNHQLQGGTSPSAPTIWFPHGTSHINTYPPVYPVDSSPSTRELPLSNGSVYGVSGQGGISYVPQNMGYPTAAYPTSAYPTAAYPIMAYNSAGTPSTNVADMFPNVPTSTYADPSQSNVPSATFHPNPSLALSSATQRPPHIDVPVSPMDLRHIQRQVNGTPIIAGGIFKGNRDVRPVNLVKRRIEEAVSSYAGDAVFYYYYLRRTVEADVIENLLLPVPSGTRSSYAMIVNLFWARLTVAIDPDGETSKILAAWNALTMQGEESFVDFLAKFESAQRALAAVGNPMTPELAKQALLSKITPTLQQFAKTHQLDNYSRLICRITLEDRERRQQQPHRSRLAGRSTASEVSGIEETTEVAANSIAVNQPTCRRCGKANHLAKDCHQREPEFMSKRCKRCGRRHLVSACSLPSDVLCTRCHGIGHTCVICPYPWKSDFNQSNGNNTKGASRDGTVEHVKPTPSTSAASTPSGLQQLAYNFEVDGSESSKIGDVHHDCQEIGNYLSTTSPHQVSFLLFDKNASQTKVVSGLLDTGAAKSCLSRAYFEQLKAEGYVHQEVPVTNTYIRAANSTRTPITTSVVLKLRFVTPICDGARSQPQPLPYVFYVCDALSRPVIFSTDVCGQSVTGEATLWRLEGGSSSQIAGGLRISAETFRQLVKVCRLDGEADLYKFLNEYSSSRADNQQIDSFTPFATCITSEDHDSSKPSTYAEADLNGKVSSPQSVLQAQMGTGATVDDSCLEVQWHDLCSEDILDFNLCWPSLDPVTNETNSGDATWPPIDYDLCTEDDITYATTKADGQKRGFYTLPWKSEARPQPNVITELHKNRSLCVRLAKRGVLAAYSGVIDDMLAKGYIFEVPISTLVRHRCHCIYHFPILNASSTSPIRPVWDCRNINRYLNASPTSPSHCSTLSHLLRFRRYRWVFVTDQTQAFLQLVLHYDVRRFVCFIHNDRAFVVARVFFGLSCAPFCLQDTVERQLRPVVESLDGQEAISDNHQKDLPLRSTPLIEDCDSKKEGEFGDVGAYMDDVVGGSDDRDTRDRLLHDTASALRAKGLQDNVAKRIINFLVGDDSTRITPISTSTKKVLGYLYDVGADCIMAASLTKLVTAYQNGVPNNRKQLRSTVAKFYDPLGLLLELSMGIKLILNTIDDIPDIPDSLPFDDYPRDCSSPKDIHQWFTTVSSQVPVPRHICSLNGEGTLCVYTDATLRAWACVCEVGENGERIYARGGIFGKAVSPTTFKAPRAELCAVLQGLQTVQLLHSQFRPFANVVILTDSRLNYHRLTRKTPKKEWTPWEVARLRKVLVFYNLLTKAGSHVWMAHCPGAINPADHPSRGRLPPPRQDHSYYVRQHLFRGAVLRAVHTDGVSDHPDVHLKSISLQIPDDFSSSTRPKAVPTNRAYNQRAQDDDDDDYFSYDIDDVIAGVQQFALFVVDAQGSSVEEVLRGDHLRAHQLYQYSLLSKVFSGWQLNSLDAITLRTPARDVLEILTKKAQATDPETIELVRKLRRPTDYNAPLPRHYHQYLGLEDWSDENGDSQILVRRSRYDGDQLLQQCIVPASEHLLQRLITIRYHCKYGHVGRVRTRNNISRRFFWRKLGATVSRTLRTCTTCVTLRDQRRFQPTGGSKKVSELDIWQYCAVDGLGPLRVNEDLIENDDSDPRKRLATIRLIVISDLVSGFCDAEYTCSFDKEDTLYSVSTILWRRGWRTYLLADNHKSFTNKDFRKAILQHGSRLLFSGMNNPAMNGATERSHSILLYTLKCLLRGRKPDLMTFKLILQKALFLVNVRRRLDACCSPFYLLHSREPRIPGLPQPTEDDDEQNMSGVSCTNADALDGQPVEVTKAARRQQLRLTKLRDVIQAYEKNREAKRLSGRGSPHASRSPFRPGDQVFVFTRKSSKMANSYRGPYQVQAATTHTLVVKTSRGYEVHSVNNCKLCSTVDEQNRPFVRLFDDVDDDDVEGFMKKTILLKRQEAARCPATTSPIAQDGPSSHSLPPPKSSSGPSSGSGPVTRSQTGTVPKKILMRNVYAS
ncbi:gag/pol/env polyprotein, putative [Perkinsus marinus ATCC 50983]|uniref:Gag/pol/env polyprotein, putative n=1 Tax=Perkinsus marinus (strain ATCC 50983 / TXsc) TaxID=423536 RepID=C5L9X4_PERM5|nr:gag/pol/env polyprotein, putative [Perkinsus marinus ATCC 50983]EER06230.1 gag/pol/env polyprotein, putative [Perkinsus marinus ATCC 50983]|eukprot:XP_002774414.1 gag/pol/env polyprotein, putative [Perkinsus marinus ATCC 50983]